MGPAPIVIAIVVGGVMACGVFVATGMVVVPIVIDKFNLRIRYKKGRNYIEIAQDNNSSLVTDPGTNNSYLAGDIPKWKKVPLQREDKEIFQKLTKEQFISRCEVYRCPITQQVMRDPVGMSCCEGKQLGEKLHVQYFIQDKKACPFCGSKEKTRKSIIYQNSHITMAIEGIETLRKQLKLTFKKLSGQLLKQFQVCINEQFGMNYSKKYVAQGDSEIFSSKSIILE